MFWKTCLLTNTKYKERIFIKVKEVRETYNDMIDLNSRMMIYFNNDLFSIVSLPSNITFIEKKVHWHPQSEK